MLGAIIYSLSTQRPVPTQQAIKRTQLELQPESQQQHASLAAAVKQDDCTDSSCSGAHIRTASFGAQSQPACRPAAAADEVSDAAASLDSSALSAVSTHRRVVSKQYVGVPVAHGPQSTEVLSSSRDDHVEDDAESLIPSSSGLQPGNRGLRYELCQCRPAVLCLVSLPALSKSHV